MHTPLYLMPNMNMVMALYQFCPEKSHIHSNHSQPLQTVRSIQHEQQMKGHVKVYKRCLRFTGSSHR